jgi:chlorobactene lauroyltransferase
VKALRLPWRKGEEEMTFHPANKVPWGEWLVTRAVISPGLKRAFGGVYVHIDKATLRLRGRSTPIPVIFCLTHSGWWDGYLTYVLNHKIFRHDAYLMMEEANLKKFWFFTWVGVFGIDRDDARKALASIEYITGLLREEPGRALWMFPQGTMTHPDARPLKIYGGVANIARRLGRCAIVPVAIRYDFLMEQAPDAFVRIGRPIMLDTETERVTSRELTTRLTEGMAQTADDLRADVMAFNHEPGRMRPYRRLLQGRGSINQLWDSFLKTPGKVKSVIKGKTADRG